MPRTGGCRVTRTVPVDVRVRASMNVTVPSPLPDGEHGAVRAQGEAGPALALPLPNLNGLPSRRAPLRSQMKTRPSSAEL